MRYLAPIEYPLDTIDTYNLYALILHAVSAILLIVLTVGHDHWPVYAIINQVDWIAVNASETHRRCDDVQCRIQVKQGVVGRIPLEWLVVTFHAMSVVAHACNRFWLRDTYIEWLKRKMNPGRWLEYFFSASIMQTVIMALSGFTNVWTLIFATVMLAVTQLFGHATEQYLWASRNEKLLFWERWQFFLYGFISFLPPWIAIYYQFYYSVLNSEGPGPPDWVNAIIWSLVIVFLSFAAVMIRYVRNWDEHDVSFTAEKWYCVLSLVSKTILTWQLYFGVYMRAQRDLIAYDPREI